MNQIIKNIVKSLALMVTTAFVFIVPTFFNNIQANAQLVREDADDIVNSAWLDAYKTSYEYVTGSKECTFSATGCITCFWPNVWDGGRNFNVCGSCPAGSHYHADVYKDSCTGVEVCGNEYMPKPYTIYYYGTAYTCHYISEVKTWSVCANGVQVATDVTWSTKPYVAATCVNIPLTQICGPSADIKANGSDGPITINHDAQATISWTSANRDICAVSLSGKPKLWDGTSGSQLSGLLTDYINPTVYELECSSFDGSPSLIDEVAINVTPPPCTPTPGVCATGPNRCNPEISVTDSLCSSGSPADLYNPQIPSSGGAPEGRFTWKCLGSCGGANATNCSSERSNPLIDTSSEGTFSNCTLSCGGGNKTREINYHNCYNKTETQACNSHPCPPGYREVAPW